MRRAQRIGRVYVGVVVVLFLALLGYGVVGAFTPRQPGVIVGNAIDWPEFDAGATRTGFNPNEIVVTTKTISRLHRLWEATLPGVSHTAPIVISNLRFSLGTNHDVLYTVTGAGQLVALDASSGATLWTHSVGGAPGAHPYLTAPVADPLRQAIYAYGFDGALHKYAALTGNEITGAGWPIAITRKPESEQVVSAPLIDGKYLYVVTTGYTAGVSDAQGHIVSIELATGKSTVFNTLCSEVHHLLAPHECPYTGSGIASLAGAILDPTTHSVLITTSSGPFDGKVSGHNWGESVLSLSHDLYLFDSYTPSTHRVADTAGQAQDTSTLALLPSQTTSKTPLLLVQVTSDGTIRLLNDANLSGGGFAGDVGGEVATIPSQGCAVAAQPAVWVDAVGTRGQVTVQDGVDIPAPPVETNNTWVYLATTCGLRAYQVLTDDTGVTHLQPAWRDSLVTTSPIVAGGMIFVASQGQMVALDPETGAHKWLSPPGDLGSIDRQSPILVNGVLYCADNDGKLVAYGLW